MFGIVIISLLLGDFLPNFLHICLNLLLSHPCDVSVVSFTYSQGAMDKKIGNEMDISKLLQKHSF